MFRLITKVFFCLLVCFSLNAEKSLSLDFPYSEYANDKDYDGVKDARDNCPETYNPSQDDSDGDGIGDVCDQDDCGCTNEMQKIYVCQDGKTRRVNCSALSDDSTTCGPCEDKKEKPCETCEADERGNIRLCLIKPGRKLMNVAGRCGDLQKYYDKDGDLVNNVECGPCNCAMIGDTDSDGDGVCDSLDECPDNPNKSQAGMCGCDKYDSDGDWVCDEDDICPGFSDKVDSDGDGVPDGCDVCEGKDDNLDVNNNGIPDGCETCASGDSDNDGICDDVDICAGFDDKIDSDGDGVPDGCDLCQGADDGQDQDLDGKPDACDVCPLDYFDDQDRDGVCDSNDQCPGGDDRIDSDGDGVPDACDTCANGHGGDADGDGVCDSNDRCPGGDDTVDNDGNGIPDACDEQKCYTSGNSEFEFIQDVKINTWFNLTNDNGGYAQFEEPSLMFYPGDSIKLWVTPGYIDRVAELSYAIYIDWNGDKDFDDEGEFVYHTRSLRERGRDMVIPSYARPGKICVRFIVDYGRINGPCDPCIDGEVEDYIITIKGESCTATSESFDYMLDVPLQGLDGGTGWDGPWRAMVSGNPKARILQGSLFATNNQARGQKLGILTPPDNNYMILRRFNVDSEDVWMSFNYFRRGGEGSFDIMLGDNDENLTIGTDGILRIGNQAGQRLPMGAPSFIVVNITRTTNGHSVRAWVNPQASGPLNPAAAVTATGISLTETIDQVIFGFTGNDPIQATDHYIDEIRLGCQDSDVRIADQGGNNPTNFALELTIAPNPIRAGTNAGITLSNASFFQGTMNLYTMSGSLVLTQHAVAGLNILQTSELAPGMYVLEIVTDAGRVTEKLVVQS